MYVMRGPARVSIEHDRPFFPERFIYVIFTFEAQRTVKPSAIARCNAARRLQFEKPAAGFWSTNGNRACL